MRKGIVPGTANLNLRVYHGIGLVSGFPCALYSIYCLGVSTILESEKIAINVAYK